METTELYVEYIIIGMETLFWIILSVFIIIGNSFVEILKYCVTNILPSIIIIGLCYILGLITDRIADVLLDNRKTKIKNRYVIKSKTSIAIWEKYDNSSYAKFTLSRIRILRSTILNSLIIGILGAYLSYIYINSTLSIFVFSLLLIIFLCANSAHKKLLDNYYKKTSALEKESEKKETKIIIP